MQDLLTQTSVVFELVSFGYVAGSFAVYARNRVHQDLSWERKPTARVAHQRMPEPPTASTAKRKLSPVELLRQQCQQAGIKWRDAHGKNRHLKKAEMIEALKRSTLSKPIAPPSATPEKRKAA
ncbi:MAG TPA: hypothetical protein V6D18_00340 [Thermosynechococcaceae cyanobacterium]